MKKLFSVIGLLVVILALFSLCSAAVFGLGTDIYAEVDVDVSDPAGWGCTDPIIHIDHTARGWYPGDGTQNTAQEYGNLDQGGKYDCAGDGDYDAPLTDTDYDRVILPERQNYIFTGETLDYYVALYDPDADRATNSVQMVIGGGVTNITMACAPVVIDDLAGADPQCAQEFDEDAFGVAYGPNIVTYICKLIVDDTMNDTLNGQSSNVLIQAVDACSGNTTVSIDSDYMFFNPTLALELNNGPIEFGSVTAGSTAISGTVYIGNVKPVLTDPASGVIMDMYISSDNYFTDPGNSSAICGAGNGIGYDRFSFYATKGSINSGENDNNFPGVSLLAAPDCVADAEGFTPLVDESGSNPQSMCRIINDEREGSFLTQGAEMSITFKVDVPTPCLGSFTDGQFYFVGEVV